MPGQQVSIQEHGRSLSGPFPSDTQQPIVDCGRHYPSGSQQSSNLAFRNTNIGPSTARTYDDRSYLPNSHWQNLIDSQSSTSSVKSPEHPGFRHGVSLPLTQNVEEDAVQEDEDWPVGIMEGLDSDDQAFNVGHPSSQTVASDPFDSESLTDRHSQLQSFANSYESGPRIAIPQFSQSELSGEYQLQHQSSAPLGDLLDPRQHHLNPSNDLDALVGAEDPSYSGRFQDGVAASFPTTAHSFPPNLGERTSLPESAPLLRSVSTSKTRLRGNTIPSNFPQTPSIRLPDRGTPRTRKSRTNSVSALSEKGSKTLSPIGVQKGRRNKPLSLASALAAAQKRKDKTTCIRCRYHKVIVSYTHDDYLVTY